MQKIVPVEIIHNILYIIATLYYLSYELSLSTFVTKGTIILLQNMEQLVEVNNSLQFLLNLFLKGRHTFNFPLSCILSVEVQI